MRGSKKFQVHPSPTFLNGIALRCWWHVSTKFEVVVARVALDFQWVEAMEVLIDNLRVHCPRNLLSHLTWRPTWIGSCRSFPWSHQPLCTNSVWKDIHSTSRQSFWHKTILHQTFWIYFKSSPVFGGCQSLSLIQEHCDIIDEIWRMVFMYCCNICSCHALTLIMV